MEDEEVKKPRKKRKKVNAFGSDDLIDYNVMIQKMKSLSMTKTLIAMT